ncbi:hypothetical protein L0F63_002453 [Massospora cicadina]|nr:hypothetical protein L0F63_002453 [Massospora cicadina]
MPGTTSVRILWALITLSKLPFSLANNETLNEREIRCSGIYSKPDFPNGNQASVTIEVRLPKFPDSSSNWAAVFASMDYKDFDGLGHPLIKPAFAEREYICTNAAVDDQLCSKEELGHYLINKGFKSDNNTLQTFYKPLTTEHGYAASATYKVNATGYVCVSADVVKLSADNKTVLSTTNQFLGVLEWINPYGKLPAADHPKLTFYGTMSLIYLVIGGIWSVGCFRYWKDILPIQMYISGVLLFLILEMAANYGYLDNFNQTGHKSYLLFTLVVLLDAARNSLCFFILLLVSLGYSVVRPSLGSTMWRCQLLTLVHFVCGCIYSAGALLTDPDRAGLAVFLFILPLSLTMTTFYVWIMQSMATTIEQLEQRQQQVKLQMYRHLRYAIIGSIALLLAYFVVNGLFFHKADDREFINSQWQTRWFLIDGWLSVLFFTIFAAIMWLWRPTANNQKYGLQELAQDEAAADALDLEARAPDQAELAGPKNLPPYPEDGVNIFDIGDLDEELERPSN